MSASTTYTPLRDDTTHRSLSTNERIFLRTTATGTALNTSTTTTSTSKINSILRTDGRTPSTPRPLRLSFSRSHNSSECTVHYGGGSSSTRISTIVTASLLPPPYPDRPNDGSVQFSVDASPMCCMGFEYASPVSTSGKSTGSMTPEQKMVSNRILRLLERTIVVGGAMDAEALCVQSGKWCWRLNVDVTVLDHGGNLEDACLLCAMAALRHFRKPEVDVHGTNDEEEDTNQGTPKILTGEEKEATPLPIHHTPLSSTFCLFADPTGETTIVSALLDPTVREELVAHDLGGGMVTFSFNKYGELCCLDFPGGCELKMRQLVQCATLASRRCGEVCGVLEEALVRAEAGCQRERLERIQRLALLNLRGVGKEGGVSPPPPLLSAVSEPPNGPYAHQTDPLRDGGTTMEIDNANLIEIGSSQAEAAAEEERYRLKALDYALGHVAAKVKENVVKKTTRDDANTKNALGSKSLMAAMLQSAQCHRDVTMENDGGEGEDDGINAFSSSSSRRTVEADEEFARLANDTNDQDENVKSSSHTATTTTTTTTAVTRQPSKGMATKQSIAEDEDDEDDEEEVTTTLQSEFSTIATATTTSTTTPSSSSSAKSNIVTQSQDDSTPTQKKKNPTTTTHQEEEEDVDDLAMAVKKKSKKSSKKSRRK